MGLVMTGTPRSLIRGFFLSDGCDGIAGAICSVFTAFREVLGVRTFQIGIFEDGKQTAQLKSLGVQI